MEKTKQKIENQELNEKIESLFHAKVTQQSKRKRMSSQICYFYESNQTIQFYGKFQEQIKLAKLNLLLFLEENISILDIDQKQRLRTKIQPLLRDLNILLDQGIFDYLYQMTQLVKGSQREEFKDMAKRILDISMPIIKKYFIHKQFLRIKTTQKSVVQAKKQKNEKRNSKQNNHFRNSIVLLRIQDIEDLYQSLSLQQLIQKHLDKQQESMDQTLQICRLCSTKVKLGSLANHLNFCEKRQSLKKKIKKLDLQLKQLLFQFQKTSFVHEVSNDDSQQTICLLMVIKKILKNSQQRIQTPRRASVFTDKQSIKTLFDVTNDIDDFVQKFGIQGNLLRYSRLVKQKQVLLNQIQILYRKQNERSQSCSSFKSYSSRQSSKDKTQNLVKTQKYKKSSFIQVKLDESSDQQGQKQPFLPLRLKNKNKTIKISRSSLNASKNSGLSKSSQSISYHDEQSKAEIAKQKQQTQKSQSDKFSIKSSQRFNSISDCQSQKRQKKKQPKGKQNKLSPGRGVDSHKPSRFKDQRAKGKKTTIFSLLRQEDQDSNSQQRNAISHSDMPVCVEQSNQQALQLDNFQFLSFLGKGAFGKVYLARRKNTLDLYAIKMIIIQESWGDKQMKLIKNEYQTFKHTGGNHLVKAPFAFSSHNGFFFVMEYMPGGDLGNLLTEEVYLEEEVAKFYLAEIVLAIEHLHECKVIHRDLKPQNLVFDAQGHLKLTDFGLSETRINDKIEKVKRESDKYQMQLQNKSRIKRQRRSALVQCKQEIRLIGTPDYIAPEIINGTSTTNQSIDWWSFGVMAYEIIIGVRPFAGDTIEEVIQNIISYNIEWPEVGKEEGMISPQAKDLILRLTERNYMNRLGANGTDEIKSHPFFKGIDWVHIKTVNPPLKKNKQIGLQIYDKKEDEKIRKQIETTIGFNSERGSTRSGNESTPSKSISKFRLSNFVRYDILQKETFNSAQKVIKQKSTKIKKLRSLMQSLKPHQQRIEQVNENAFQQMLQEQYKSSKNLELTIDQII